MKAHGRFEGNLRLQVPEKVVAECGLRLSRVLHSYIAELLMKDNEFVDVLKIKQYVIFDAINMTSYLELLLVKKKHNSMT